MMAFWLVFIPWFIVAFVGAVASWANVREDLVVPWLLWPLVPFFWLVRRLVRKPTPLSQEERLKRQIAQTKENLRLLDLQRELDKLESYYLRRLENGE